MESAPAEHSAANSRAKTQRTPKSGLAKRYQVGIRTIENWQYSGVIYARSEQKEAIIFVNANATWPNALRKSSACR